MQGRGFSLIELMIVVAIIGILAALGLAGYQKYMLSAQMSEGRSILIDIAAKEEAYYATWEKYLDTKPNPVDIPKSRLEPWKSGEQDWENLGFALKEPSRWQYEVDVPSDETFRASAVSELSGKRVTMCNTSESNVVRDSESLGKVQVFEICELP